MFKISARNQLAGKVVSVKEGAVNAIVTLDVAGTPITGTISVAAVKELDLAPGKDADLLLVDGDPFSPYVHPEKVVVGGVEVRKK